MAQEEGTATVDAEELSLPAEEILADYQLALESRFASIIGRREVLSGKAKFGIFGDGKEIAQIAMAKAWQPGDIRAGYYRDQTLFFALGLHTIQEFFAQLYAHAELEAEPMTGGRAMNAHFATRSLNPDGSWSDLTAGYNSSVDLSPTGSQMPRLVGLTYASRLYRQVPDLAAFKEFSRNGNEVAWGTIGNASCAEGMFWEAINAIGVLGGPMVLSIWDDGYGISVPNEYQIVHGDLSTALSGFRRQPGSQTGFDLYRVKGWDYPDLVQVYQEAAAIAREEHVPAIIHVVEMTQPQGHSTSGSHERYKSPERLEWETTFDCINKMREWMLERGVADADDLDAMEQETRKHIETIRREAWQAYLAPIRKELEEVSDMIDEMATYSAHEQALSEIKRRLNRKQNPNRKDVMQAVREVLITLRNEDNPTRQVLIDWKEKQEAVNRERYGSHLYSESEKSARRVPRVEPVYSRESPTVSGFEVLNAAFDAMLERDPRVFAFGEDLGALGGVNQGFAGLQAKYGPMRVSDTGIREMTIIGQAIGMALRGLRPIAELQYLDYVLYALQIMSDDLATIHWRTRGGQKAPVIVRTRGHRLEGIWHSGSQMAGIINLVRGMNVLVPRDMTRAAAFY
ncbi:MAG: thiamine pyrophosphate-dependent enzyme, partial [Chloroflexota bacterium]